MPSMQYEELKDQFKFNEAETQTYLPNEIFNELKVIKNPQHRAFAYTYIYLTTYLWRYAKYGSIPYANLTQDKLKQILGRKGDERLNYLIKKNGVLEEMKWLETTNDFPIISEYRKEDDYLEFTYLSEWKDTDMWENVKPPNRFTVKRPIRGYNRFPNDLELQEDYENGDQDGTFEHIENTHQIPLEVFMYCMSKKEVGIKGFYMYAYLFSKDKMFGGNGYDVTLVNLSKQLGIPEKTVDRYLDIVRKFNMVVGLHNQDYFAIGMKKEQRKANTYITNNIELFENKPIQYAKIKIMAKQEYLKILDDEKKKMEAEELEKYGVIVTKEQLPF